MTLPHTIRLSVTQADIDAGTPNCPWTCPVAIAASRVSANASVGLSSLYLYDDGVSQPYCDSTDAGHVYDEGSYSPLQRFIGEFDDGGDALVPTEPVTLTLSRCNHVTRFDWPE
jgi:hypothetical protein